MTKPKLLAATAVVVGAIAFICYCIENRISSISDWNTRRAALSERHPINQSLASGKLSLHTTVAELSKIASPTETADFGRIEYYWFRPEPDSCQVAIFVDDRLTSVVVTEQNYSWTFFGYPDAKLVDAMQTVRLIRDQLSADPMLAEALLGKLKSALLTLGLPPEAPLPADSKTLQVQIENG